MEGARLQRLATPGKPGFIHGVFLLAGPLGQSWVFPSRLLWFSLVNLNAIKRFFLSLFGMGSLVEAETVVLGIYLFTV